MNWNFIYALLAALAGCCIAMQASANGMFRRNLGEPWYPTFFSICGTSITAVVLMLLMRPSAPAMETLRSTQWWNWVGGPLGAMIVLAGASLSHKLGAPPFIVLVVGGQLLCSVVLDHFALMGLAAKPITWGRALGVVLVIAGVLCIKEL